MKHAIPFDCGRVRLSSIMLDVNVMSYLGSRQFGMPFAPVDG